MRSYLSESARNCDGKVHARSIELGLVSPVFEARHGVSVEGSSPSKRTFWLCRCCSFPSLIRRHSLRYDLNECGVGNRGAPASDVGRRLGLGWARSVLVDSGGVIPTRNGRPPAWKAPPTENPAWIAVLTSVGASGSFGSYFCRGFEPQIGHHFVNDRLQFSATDSQAFPSV